MLKTVKDKLGPDVFGYAEGGTGAWSVLPWIWSFGGGITDRRPDARHRVSSTARGPSRL